ncbi:MAG: phosphatase PAP2 family protein [Chitinophagales bacterium]|nr:phosphatase PAP2 family protein [Chitinophagales bacterium]
MLFQSIMTLYGQNSTYSLSLAREISFFATGLSFNALGAIQSRNTSVLRVEDIEKLSRNVLDGLDRTATYNYSLKAKGMSDKLLLGSLVLPTTIMLDPNQRNQLGEKTTMLLQTYLINAGSTLLVKSLVRRTRPFVYNENVPLSEKLKADARMSFFSGHTSFTASSAFFTASMLTANGQNKNLAPIIWSSAAVLPAVQGYLRWKAGKHFPTDIFIGYAIGAGLGYLIPKIHEGF